MSNHVGGDEHRYSLELNDSDNSSIQPFLLLPLTETLKTHISVNGPLLSGSFSNDTKAEIAEMVREELTSRKEKLPLRKNQRFDITLKGLDLSSILETYLSDAISEKLQNLLSAKQSPKDELSGHSELREIEQPLSGPREGLCICAGNPPTNEYPVIDPRSVAGPLPHVYALFFPDDVLRMKVEEDVSLSGCQMWVGLESQVSWAKEIAGWHLCNQQVMSVSTSGSNTGPNFMLLQKAECQSGVHTILFKKAKFLGVMTGMYTLNMNTFWPYLGGKKVTFTWISDTEGRPSPSFSREDGALLKEESTDPTFVIFGGAKFWIPSPAEFEALGYDSANVKTVPNGGLASITSVPHDGTLLKERSTDPVFLIKGGKKFHISSPTRFHELCLYWENLRVVPDAALATIPVGGTL
jgi:hypothetical protein